nr:putative tyrosinase-like protein tyr-3 [Penaeus vannamei]
MKSLRFDYISSLLYPYLTFLSFKYPLDIQGLNLLYKCSGKPVPPAACVDSHVNCPSWASLGYCRTNPAYMSTSCKKSCNICGGGSGCVDKGPHCTSWAAKGECQRNPSYVNDVCGGILQQQEPALSGLGQEGGVPAQCGLHASVLLQGVRPLLKT